MSHPVKLSAIRAIGHVCCFGLAIFLVLALLDPPLAHAVSGLLGIPAPATASNVLDAPVIALRWIDVGLVLLVLAGAARLEQLRMDAYGLPWRWSAVTHLGAGTTIGVITVTLVCGALALACVMSLGAALLPAYGLMASGLRWGLAFLAVAVLEELLFRGYPLTTLARGIGFWPAALALSLLFTAAHVRNAGESAPGLLAVFLFGMLFCAIRQRTGALWLSIGVHAGWDWAQSFLFGVPDSGTIARGRAFAPVFRGASWLTGGSAGPEGSVLTLAALAGALLVLAWVSLRDHGARTGRRLLVRN